MKLLTNNFKTHLIDQFIESVSEPSNTIYYMCLGNSIPWPDDDEPPMPEKSVFADYTNRENILYGKNITEADVSHGVYYHMWQENSVYAMYDDKNQNMKDTVFFVVSEEENDSYSVFKCLGNNNGSPVFAKPSITESSETAVYYRTADKYEWKFMFNIPGSLYRKFASDEIIPIVYNQTVIDNALSSPNGIEHIKVIDGGDLYNNYAYGTIQQAEISGDPLIHSLETDNVSTLYTYDIFDQTASLDQNKNFFFKLGDNSVWTVSSIKVKQEFYSYVGSTLKCITDTIYTIPLNISKIYQTNNDAFDGTVIYEATISSYRQDVLPKLSANTDFYKNNYFYIREGRGLGQLKIISEYIVTGNQRRVLLDEPFDIVPDSTSKFEILPRIIIEGDGKDAIAIPVMDTTSNTIIQVEILNSGSDYTFANIITAANTGSVEANNAILEPIISPIGGHASDPKNELYSDTLIISKEFNSDESGKLSTENDFRTISLMKNPLFDNLVLELDQSALLFIDGETVKQIETNSFGTVSGRLGNNLTLTNVRGLFQTTYDLVTDRISSNVSVGIVSKNKDLSIFDNRIKLAVEMTYTGVDGQGFLEDDEVIQVSPASAYGFVHSVSSNIISVVKSRGIWNISDDLTSVLVEIKSLRNQATAKITGTIQGDFVKISGEILYVENVVPVQRNIGQKEQIKLYITL